MGAHSTWSASGFEQKMLCPGSHVLQAGLPNTSSKYAAEGTAAHQVLTWSLQQSRPAAAYVGQTINVEGFDIEVDDDMAEYVQTCIDYVHDAAGEGVILVDQRVNYSTYLDVPESAAWGTADVIIIRDDEIIVVDFKYGRGVEVSAESNPQMSLYALGALQAYQGLVGDFKRVRMVISQPRIKSTPSEYDLTVDELEYWAHFAARGAVDKCNNAKVAPEVDGWVEVFLQPGEKQCRFCRAKATCPALAEKVERTVGADFEDIEVTQTRITLFKEDAEFIKPSLIASHLAAVDMIEDWCKAVRAEAERRLLAGKDVPGWKIVQGKRGNRAWSKPADVEALLKSMRLKEAEMYDFKLISPTTAEKLHKTEVIGPRQWAKIQEFISQKDGSPHVAPESDSRPALEIRPVADDFDLVA
jgi:hypothetical protein